MQRPLHVEGPRSAPPRSTPPRSPVAQFYREEFIRHQQCLRQQREYYSEQAIHDVEAAIARILAQLEQLSVQQDADKVVSRLLRQFDVLTGLSAWSDRRNVH